MRLCNNPVSPMTGTETTPSTNLVAAAAAGLVAVLDFDVQTVIPDAINGPNLLRHIEGYLFHIVVRVVVVVDCANNY
jgi:hypothetical protein